MNIVVVMKMAMIMGRRNTETRARGCGYMVGEDGRGDERRCRSMDEGGIGEAMRAAERKRTEKMRKETMHVYVHAYVHDNCICMSIYNRMY